MKRIFVFAAILCALARGDDGVRQCAVEALLPGDSEGVCALIGDSAIMRELRQDISLVAPHKDVPVLIVGRTGTGKENVARRIHKLSPRANEPFLPINCAALPEALIEGQLFGYKKGAFTGATSDNPGLFVSAGEGTLFLDEVGELPYALQAKLLRALQHKEVLPVGSNTPVPVHARVLAATNRNMETAIKDGKFREDLYYRLAVWEIFTPDLAAHLEDMDEITRFLLRRIQQQLNLDRRLSVDALAALKQYNWPGNVRQLESVLTRAVILSGDSPVILPRHFPSRLLPASVPLRVAGSTTPTDVDEFNLDARERATIIAALNATGWNKSDAARRLGIERSTLDRKIRSYGLEPPSRLQPTGTAN